MLQVDRLVKDYKGFRAVNDVSFTMNPGEIVGLLGPNGAGKTTVLRCIAGILQPTHGSVHINGFEINREPEKAKARMAFVPELPSLYELLTVDEHVRFVAMCFNALDDYEPRANALLDRYHLTEKRKELVATLSKGMRQKLAIVCALIHNSNVMLFDEPIIGIDPAGVAEVKAALMEQRNQGTAILVSTHLLDTAEKLCDRVIIMAKGSLLASGTLEELRRLPGMSGMSLEQAFLRLTGEDPIHEAPPVFDL